MEKRLISIKELADYAGVGKSRAYELAEISGAQIRYGNRILVDRVRLDRFLDTAEKIG